MLRLVPRFQDEDHEGSPTGSDVLRMTSPCILFAEKAKSHRIRKKERVAAYRVVSDRSWQEGGVAGGIRHYEEKSRSRSCHRDSCCCAPSSEFDAFAAIGSPCRMSAEEGTVDVSREASVRLACCVRPSFVVRRPGELRKNEIRNISERSSLSGIV